MISSRALVWLSISAALAVFPLGGCNGDSGSTSGTTIVPSTSSGSGTPTGSTCHDQGASCAKNAECCGYGEGNSVCVNTGTEALCAGTCTKGSDCKSGCCTSLKEGGHVCAPSSYCGGTGGSGGGGSGGSSGGSGGSCKTTGTSCTQNGDCCGYASGASTCISDDNLCHDRCTKGSDCKSGCCAPLKSGGGVCASASWCG